MHPAWHLLQSSWHSECTNITLVLPGSYRTCATFCSAFFFNRFCWVSYPATVPLFMGSLQSDDDGSSQVRRRGLSNRTNKGPSHRAINHHKRPPRSMSHLDVPWPAPAVTIYSVLSSGAKTVVTPGVPARSWRKPTDNHRYPRFFQSHVFWN